MGEKWWESALAGIGLVGSILVLTALLLMLQPPQERVVFEGERLTITQRVSK